MSFLLDTNIVSFHLERPRLMHRFVQYSGRLYVSSVALAELYVWAFGKPDPRSSLAAIDVMLYAMMRATEAGSRSRSAYPAGWSARRNAAPTGRPQSKGSPWDRTRASAARQR